MPVIDSARNRWDDPSLTSRVGAFLYSFNIGFVFASVEIFVLGGLPLYALRSIGAISATAYGGAVFALMLTALSMAAGRTGPSNLWVHWTTPWPEWWAVGRFARNWIAAMLGDGVVRVMFFYAGASLIGGGAVTLIDWEPSYVFAFMLVGLLVHGQAYNTPLPNTWFWGRS